jgi:hypothetical protein
VISLDTDDEDAADADAEAVNKSRKKGMSEVEKKKAMWRRLTASPCVIDTTTTVAVVKGGPPKSREDIYMESGFVTCTLDGTTYNVGLFMGNHSQHLRSAKHVGAEKRAAPAGGINLFVKKGPGLNAEQLAARTACLKEIRILGHAAAIGLGSSPRQIVVQSSGIMDDVKQALKGSPYSIGSSEHTVARDRDAAVTMLDDYLKAAFRGKFLCINTDGVGFRRRKTIVVLANAAQLPAPALLAVIFPDEDSEFVKKPVYDFKRGAVDIWKQVDKYEILHSHITGLGADNTGSQVRLAKALKMPIIKCGAHVENFMAKLVKELKGWNEIVQDLGGSIFAGGSIKIALELKSKGLSPRSMLMHEGRFATGLQAAQYDYTNFDKIYEWITTSQLMNLGKGGGAAGASVAAAAAAAAGGGSMGSDAEADVDEDASGDEDCSSDEESDAAGRKDRAVRAWKSKIAPAILRIGNTIFEHSRDLITDLSGEGDSVPSDILDKLKAQKRHFSLISADPSCVVAPALEAHNIRLPPKEVSAMCANVKEVVDLVIKKFDKHFGVIMPMLEHRFMYTPRNKPKPPPTDPKTWKQFLGCLPGADGPTIRGQYIEYYEEMTKMHQADEAKAEDDRVCKRIDSVKYWESKEKKWGALASVAFWHLNFPTSNISSERVGAVLRADEAAWTRSQQSSGTVENDAKVTCNLVFVEAMLRAKMAHFGTF